VTGRILVVDDLAHPRRALAAELAEAGYEVVEAGDGLEAWELFRRLRPDAVVSDVVMPRSDGLDLLSRIRRHSDVPVILFTARASIQSAAAAFRSGADDFVASDELGPGDLLATLEQSMQRTGLAHGAERIEARIVGTSAALRRLRERIHGLASLRSPVLVSGEAGSGRDTAVRALHEYGSSGHGRLYSIAAADALARMKIPDCSAIYLDGIERFPMPAQSFWSRYVHDCEARSFEGTPRVFASSEGPSAMLSAGSDIDQQLRDTLLRYAIELPSLRAIPQDIPLIADALTERLCAKIGRRIKLSAAARSYLARQTLPGNVRQLEDVLERSIAFSRGRQIRRDTVHDVLIELEESLGSIREHHQILEREALIRAIRESGGNITRSAEALGKSRGAVYRLIDKHNIPLRRRH